MDAKSLKFDKAILKEIASTAFERKSGARGLRSILEEIMLDVMYDLPDYKGKTITITKDVVEKTDTVKVSATSSVTAYNFVIEELNTSCNQD